MKNYLLLLLFSLITLNASSQDLFLISKKQNAKSKDYIYQSGEKLVIGINGKKKVGVFFVIDDSMMRFNDTIINRGDIEWVLVKRNWSSKVAQAGIKWGITYFLTFTINDWYRTGDPLSTRYTLRNSGTLVGLGLIAGGFSLKKCHRKNYHFFLIP